jgi:hypothetical protein
MQVTGGLSSGTWPKSTPGRDQSSFLRVPETSTAHCAAQKMPGGRHYCFAWKAVIRGSRPYAWVKVRAYALREGVNWRQAMGLAFNRHPADGS